MRPVRGGGAIRERGAHSFHLGAAERAARTASRVFTALGNHGWAARADAVWELDRPVLETGLAVGGYRLLRSPLGASRNAAVGLWLVNSALIGGWTQLFFRERQLGASAAVSGAMVATGAAYVATAARVDRPAAALAVPFVGWLGFATLLAGRIWRDNPAEGRCTA